MSKTLGLKQKLLHLFTKDTFTTISNYEKLEELITANTPNGIVKNEYIGSWNGKMASALIGIVENYNES